MSNGKKFDLIIKIDYLSYFWFIFITKLTIICVIICLYRVEF
jgi:hypothetical protein